MWLPSALYEKAPHYWLLLGLLLIVLGVYLGVEVALPYMLLGVGSGVISCAWGIRTYWRRALHRECPVKATGQS